MPSSLWGLSCSCMCACSVASVVSDSLQLYGPWLTRLLSPWDSPGKNTEVGCHFLLQGLAPRPGIKPLSSAVKMQSPNHWTPREASVQNYN